MADTIDTATSLTGDAEQGADLMRQGRFAETAMMMQGVVAAEPENEAAWRLLAGALASQSDYAGALPAFERVVELAPANPRNHYNLAVALQALGHVDDARASAERALSLDPAYAAARTFLNVTASEQPSAGIAPTADIPPRPNYAASSMTGLASIGDVAAAGPA
jgi:Flp pilus assembly protein TadD